ncbi:MAG: 50S ribosomal protein L21, partial [Candidatus Omnitrophica bacterium]|nr:50S ribosomal protein L21 [Candidatus Omnitrophota bacterium]
MFAVVQLGSSQFKVAEGETITATRMDYVPVQRIVLDKVLLVSDGKTVKIGRPFLKDAEVKAEVVGHPRGVKVVAFKYRKRKDSARTHG